MGDNKNSHEVEGKAYPGRSMAVSFSHGVLWLCTVAQAAHCPTLQVSFVLKCE